MPTLQCKFTATPARLRALRGSSEARIKCTCCAFARNACTQGARATRALAGTIVAATSGMDAAINQPATREHTDSTSLGTLLAEHHAELDQRLSALVTRAQGGDPVQLRGEWSAFEQELLAHLDLEEAEVLPAFARHDGAAALAVLDEHAAIRAQLLEMGMNLDLHLVSAERVEKLVEQLRAHARHEEQALYAWTRHNLHGDGRKMLAGALSVAAHRTRR
jgi:hypothetical protein